MRSTRTRLHKITRVNFRLDAPQPKTRREGIGPNSIWSKVIEDQDARMVEKLALEATIDVTATAAGLMSGGNALRGVVIAGLSPNLALQQYEAYVFQADAYGAQLLLQEPSLTWVVLAIVELSRTSPRFPYPPPHLLGLEEF